MQALIISIDPGLIKEIPAVLSSAGFLVDVLCLKNAVFPSRYVRNIFCCKAKEGIANEAAHVYSDQYDLVVIGDDEALSVILNSAIAPALKLNLLPVTNAIFFDHIYSKIGLAKRLYEGGILSPKFRIANSPQSAEQLAQELGLPIVLKVDSSGGGGGVYICYSFSDLSKAISKISSFPILIQEFIPGSIVDLSGFYQNGKLIYFTYSIFEKTVGGPLGPSSVRTYSQLGMLDITIFNELLKLGEVLGISGFANISCIESKQDGARYFIEADLRPTVWANFGRYLGQDLSTAINRYFSLGEHLTWPVAINTSYPPIALIPFIHRLGLFDLVSNRYHAWRYIAELSANEKIHLFVSRPISYLESWAIYLIKPLLPVVAWKCIAKKYQVFKGIVRAGFNKSL